MNSQTSEFWSQYSPNSVPRPRPRSSKPVDPPPLSSAAKPRPISIDNTLKQIRASHHEARRASKLLAANKPDSQHRVNKVKWCNIICQETKFSFSQISKVQTEQGRSGAVNPRIQAELDRCLQAFEELYSTLFSQVRSSLLGPQLICDLARSFVITAPLQSSIRCQVRWREGFRHLTKLFSDLRCDEVCDLYETCLAELREKDIIPRYQILLNSFQRVLSEYDTKWSHLRQIEELELAIQTMNTYTSTSKADEFLSLAESVPSIFRKNSKQLVSESISLVRRLSIALKFVKGRLFLSRAHEAQAVLAEKRRLNRPSSELNLAFDEAVELYSNAYELLAESNKQEGGHALFMLGQLHWKFPRDGNKAIAYRYYKRVVSLDSIIDAQYLEVAWRRIHEHKEHLRRRQADQLRREKEERERRARMEEEAKRQREEARRKQRAEQAEREKNERERQEQIRRSQWQSMEGKLNDLRELANVVTSVDDVALMLQRIEDTFPHPDPSCPDQLRQYRNTLKGQASGVRNCLKKVIRLYHPDKNGTRAEIWKYICAEITKVANLSL